jgi:hypothetical protein
LKRAENEDFFETDEFGAPSKGELNDFKNSAPISNAAIFSTKKAFCDKQRTFLMWLGLLGIEPGIF